ncbi:MAG: hypothetical protein QM767_07125 [Anaeromyxobacter sp.]
MAPTVRSSEMVTGAGSAPAFRTMAMESASSVIRWMSRPLPRVIWPRSEMVLWMVGAVSTLSSSIVAMRRWMFSEVSFSISRAPSGDIWKATTGRPLLRVSLLSAVTRASARYSPVSSVLACSR